MKFIASLQLVVMLSLTACAGGASSGSNANSAGSSPVNTDEEREYKRAINKCYKTGGSRVVKVEGRLMCY